MICARILLGLIWMMGFLSPSILVAQDEDILVDGFFDDWNGRAPVYTDAQDAPGGGIDFERLWVTNDDQYVFFSFVVGMEEISLQNEQSVTLYLDTDNDVETGQPFGELGADLVWVFGELGGTFYGTNEVSVSHGDIGLIPAPTVTSTRFEIALELNVEPRRQGPLFPTDTVVVALAASGGGDVVPDPGERIEFVIDRSAPPRSYDFDLSREIATDLRVLSWNVLQDGLFESNLTNTFRDLLTTIDPDIIAFSEIYDHTPGQTLDRLEVLYPLVDGGQWYGAGSGFDVVVASRYPTTRVASLARGSAGAFLVDLSSRGAGQILIAAAHLRCCEQDAERQRQIDEVMAYIRDAQNDGTILPETPIVVTGDMNFVGERQQLTTLTDGEIVNSTFLPSFDPDWDGSSFTDRVAQTTGLPAAYTWPGRGEDLAPGRLDFIVYSDFVLEIGRAFALNTAYMPLDVLDRLGLRPTHTVNASDHLPVVADFRGSSVTASEFELPIRLPSSAERSIVRVYPNPAHDQLFVKLDTMVSESVTASLFDVLGRVVATSAYLRGAPNGFRTELRLDGLPAGLYIVRVGTASGSQIGAAVVTIR